MQLNYAGVRERLGLVHGAARALPGLFLTLCGCANRGFMHRRRGKNLVAAFFEGVYL